MEEEEEKKSGPKGRYIFIAIFLLVVMAGYALRLADWQLRKGASFLQKAESSTQFTVPMDTARGEILDSKGNGLAVNKIGYAIEFDKAYMTTATANKTIYQLIRLLDSRKEKWTDELPIKVNSAGKYEFVSGKDQEIAALKSKDFLDVNPYATADECMKQLVEQYDCTGYSAKDTRNIVSVRYNMTKCGFSVSQPYTFADNISKDTVAIISENSVSLPGAQVKVTTLRQYPDGTLLPHILGTIGSISQEEYDAFKKLGQIKTDTNPSGYAFNDRIGKNGVEQAFESQLRGKAGAKTVELTSKGSVASETVTQKPVAGDSVYLTIDSNLQKVLNASLAKNVQATRQNGYQLCAQRYKGSATAHGEDCVAGAAVGLRVSDFAVLAASTYPSYDENKYLDNTSYYNQLLQDNTRPLINRAFNGIFTPGSIVKPYVALTALQEGSISESTLLEGNSQYTRFANTGLILGSIGSYGMINCQYAIEKSSNSFFYEAGYRTGIKALNLYAPRFGLGIKTGLELSESAGVLAGPAEKSEWWDADTCEASVGQSDNQFTPLQLASMTATIANNGTRMQPHIVDKITDYTRKNVISQTKPKTMDSIGVSQAYLDYVKQGMRDVAISGTAATMFSNYGIPIAAKTGTAVQTPHSDNVTFIAFAPYDHPQIALAVVLEHGATSFYSNSVAKDILDAYFYGKTVDKNGNIVMPSAASSQGKNSSGTSSKPSGTSSQVSGISSAPGNSSSPTHTSSGDEG